MLRPRMLAFVFGMISMAAAGRIAAQPTLTINNSSAASATTCSSTLSVSATNPVTYYGTYTYTWTLLRGTSTVATSVQTIYCPTGPFPCQLPSFSVATPATSGTFQARLSVNYPFSSPQLSNQITVNATSGGPTAWSKINGSDATDFVSVCPGGPIILDGSQSTCATSHFVSIELSDRYWNRYGGEAGQWIGPSETQQYGPIGNFNLKRFAEDRWVGFVGGQYYRVKLAVGPGWNERTQLMFIQPPEAKLKVNGNASQTVDIVGPSWPIRIDGSSSVCGASYFVSIQLSDANWGRHNYEASRWLTASDYANYGPIHNFNMKRFAEDNWFAFVPGQYYRIGLAVGPQWSGTTTLVYIKP